jgi:hypothetical protein
MAGGDGQAGGAGGMLTMLLNLLVAEKSGFLPADSSELASLKEMSERLAREATTPEAAAVDAVRST